MEVKQEKISDTYMIQKVREEIEDENHFSIIKKDHQYQVMQKLMAENEDRKRKALIEAETDRLEAIKLQNAYCELLDKQEESRQNAIRNRDLKIKDYQKKATENQGTQFDGNQYYLQPHINR